MQQAQNDLVTLIKTNHPAKNYILFGGMCCIFGLATSRLSSLLWLGTGGFLLARGAEAMRRTEERHGGNYHGTNAPPIHVTR